MSHLQASENWRTWWNCWAELIRRKKRGVTVPWIESAKSSSVKHRIRFTGWWHRSGYTQLHEEQRLGGRLHLAQTRPRQTCGPVNWSSLLTYPLTFHVPSSHQSIIKEICNWLCQNRYMGWVNKNFLRGTLVGDEAHLPSTIRRQPHSLSKW